MRETFKISSWQEFEELTRDIIELHGFKAEFRKVFRNQDRKFEVDVVATKDDLCLAIDCKLYGYSRYRRSQLRSEAEKHSIRCKELEKLVGMRVTPLIVSLLDDDLLIENGCLFVPITKLNDFLINQERYMETLSMGSVFQGL